MKQLTLLSFLTAIISGWGALLILILVSIDNNEQEKYCIISSTKDADWSFQGIACSLDKYTIMKDFGSGIVIFPLISFLLLFPLILLLKSVYTNFFKIFKLGKNKK